MKTFVVLFLACFLAMVYSFPSSSFSNSVSLTEDTLGNYRFYLNTDEFKRSEERNQNGQTNGEFTYVDNEGVLHKLVFKSGPNQGFVAQSADIPRPVPQEPENQEVVNARNEHLKVWNEAAAKFGVFEEASQAKKVTVMVPVVQYVAV